MSVAPVLKPNLVGPSLTVKRRFKAPPAKVFAAWTDAEKLKRWMGPGEIVAKSVETDARAGGRYRIVMQSSEGEYDVGGVYREVVPNERLVFTWAWKVAPPEEPHESLVTVLFEPDGEGTLLTLMHAHLYDDDSRDRHGHGWQGALDKLESFIA